MSETPKRMALTSGPHRPQSYTDGSASRPEDRAGDPVPEFAATGPFRSSWRPVLRWMVGTLVFAPLLMFGLLWLNREQIDERWLVIIALFAIGSAAYYAIRYRLFGTRWVDVTPDHVEAVPFCGAPLRLERSEPFSIVAGRDIKLRSGGRRLTVRDEGFASEDWADLTFALLDWEWEAPVSSLPGVLLPDSTAVPARTETDLASEEGDAVYVAQHDRAPFWGLPFFALAAAIGLLASWEGYGDGSWKADPMMSIGLPAFGIGICGFGLWTLSRLVRRVAFLPDGFIIERFAGKPIQLPYSAVTDAYGEHLQTTRGRFILGKRNDGSFSRLMLPRLEIEQLSGDAAAETRDALGLLWPMIAGLVAIPFGLAYLFDFSSESQYKFAILCATLLMGALTMLYVKLKSRRRRRTRPDA